MSRTALTKGGITRVSETSVKTEPCTFGPYAGLGLDASVCMRTLRVVTSSWRRSRSLRAYLCQRERFVEYAAAHIQHMRRR
jgi:hypothetical protein